MKNNFKFEDSIDKFKNIGIFTHVNSDADAITQAFNGGGHKKMGAFQADGNLEEIQAKLLAVVKKEIKLHGAKHTKKAQIEEKTFL